MLVRVLTSRNGRYQHPEALSSQLLWDLEMLLLGTVGLILRDIFCDFFLHYTLMNTDAACNFPTKHIQIEQKIVSITFKPLIRNQIC